MSRVSSWKKTPSWRTVSVWTDLKTLTSPEITDVLKGGGVGKRPWERGCNKGRSLSNCGTSKTVVGWLFTGGLYTEVVRTEFRWGWGWGRREGRGTMPGGYYRSTRGSIHGILRYFSIKLLGQSVLSFDRSVVTLVFLQKSISYTTLPSLRFSALSVCPLPSLREFLRISFCLNMYTFGIMNMTRKG